MSWAHLKDTQPKARKPHRCFLCGEPIGRGETYVRRSGIGWDGPESFAMHAECETQSAEWKSWEWEVFSEGEMPRPGSNEGGRQ